MKRLILIIVICALAAPLVLATNAQARRWDPPGPPSANEIARAEFLQYVAQVAPIYAELRDCACCCDRLDLPTHRCAACAAAAARISKVVARAHRVQRRLGGISPPDRLLVAHAELVSALSALHLSAEYMAGKVRTAPQDLLAAAYVPIPRQSGRTAIVLRPSPQLVAAAEYAALSWQGRRALRYHPMRTLDQTPTVSGTPGEHALAHLALWRAAVAAQASALYVDLPQALKA
jgi:hypothetical protein